MAGDNTQEFKLEQVGVNAAILTELKGIHSTLAEIKGDLKDSRDDTQDIRLDLATRPTKEDFDGVKKQVAEHDKKLYAIVSVVTVLNVIAGLVLKFVV